MVSRQPLKLASGVRFAHPLPLAAGGAPSGPGGAPRSERGGSRFETWAASHFLRVSFKGQDRTLRTFRLRFDSSYPYQVFGRSSNRTGRSAPNAEIVVGIPTGRPLRGVGRLVRHLIVDQADAGSIPVHRAKLFRGRLLTAGFLVLSQRMRVQLSPALPRGCRLIGKDRWLSISGCGIVTRRPYQDFGL